MLGLKCNLLRSIYFFFSFQECFGLKMFGTGEFVRENEIRKQFTVCVKVAYSAQGPFTQPFTCLQFNKCNFLYICDFFAPG